LESYHTTKEGLEEYRNEGHYFEKNQQLKQELQKAKQEVDRYKNRSRTYENLET
jgi:hypothetical protein